MQIIKGKYHWSKKDIEILEEFFPVKTNKELSEMLKCSQRTVIRKSRELKLEKHEYFRLQIDFSAAGKIGATHPNSIKTRIKKGDQVSPSTQFKKGRKSFMKLPYLERRMYQLNKKYKHLNNYK